MINNVTQIPTIYSKVDSKRNNVSTLDATEWNTLSTAVQDAHEKINDIITNGKVKDLEATDDDSISISTHGIKDQNNEGSIHILTLGSDIELCSQNLNNENNGSCDIVLNADNGANVRIDNCNLKFSDNFAGLIDSGDNSCKISDIITVVNYFKTNNTTGPFASA